MSEIVNQATETELTPVGAAEGAAEATAQKTNRDRN